jgi:hypothetical protein
MPFRTWCEADKELAAATGSATPKQQELGEFAGRSVSPSMPRIVAAAMLRLALAEELNLSAPRPISDRYKARLQILQQSSDPSISPQTEEEAEAWVTYLRLVRRRESLAKLKLHEGDIVQTKDGEVAEVSSIGQDGRVFFRGGRGFGSWPDLISVVARRDEHSDSATEARRQAKNVATRRNASSGWSSAKSQDLSEFTTENIVSEDDIAELEAVITTSDDERPIQKFLEENRHLLTALLGGNDRYCLPQKRLGGEYVPDFIIGDADSLGIRWVLVELETPKSGIYLKDGSLLDAQARKGISQVIDWRNWLSNNIAYARERRLKNGLGLFDIRERADAVVLVGRRSKMPETKDAQRHEYRQSNSIQIHSYDWLLETLRGAIQHQGPPSSNPHLIPRS